MRLTMVRPRPFLLAAARSFSDLLHGVLFSEKRNLSAKEHSSYSRLVEQRAGMDPTVGAAVGAAVALAAAPFALAAVGFTSGGIAAGSYAASMMSSAAVANGGGVAAGTVVAALQSAGAAGLSGATSAVVAGAGAAAGWVASFFG